MPDADSREGTDLLARWASAVAHEVRNPLAGIRGAVQIIGDRLPPGCAEIEVAREILRRIDSLDAVLEELLRFARPRPLAPEPVALGPLLLGLAETFQRELPEGPPVEVEDADATVRADRTMVERALLLLVRNALEAVGPGGRVVLRVEPGEAAVRIHVDDDGPGILDHDRNRLLTPFYSTRPGRHGLGLPTAHRIAIAHGGDIRFAQSPDGGARVTLILPPSRATDAREADA